MNAMTNRAPVTTVRCPVHGQLVARDGDGHLLGRCQGCVTEAAQAITWMTEYMTGPVDFPLEKLVDGARQETL